MERIIVTIGILNFILSMIYAFVMVAHKKNCIMVLFFISVPILGFVLYFLPQWIGNMMGFFDYDRESFVKRLKPRRGEKQPTMKTELDVVSIEDAMAITDNKKKRLLLLNQLKKDYLHNYKELLGAEGDSDSESAHYIAAAKMEIYRIYQKEWMEKLKEYEANPTEEQLDILLETLSKFIDSELLSEQEKNIYKKKYRLLAEEVFKMKEKTWKENVVNNYVKYLVDLKEYKKVIDFWNIHKEKLKNETTYFDMLRVFYLEKDRESFEKCLSELMNDKSIQLSSEGLSKLRYWIKKDKTK